MKEILRLPLALEGIVWRYRNAGYRHPPHRHEELEFNLILHGTGSYLMGDHRLPLRRGTLIWLFPEQDHVLIEPSHEFEMWIAVFKPAILARSCTTPATAVLKEPSPAGRFSRQLPRETLSELHGLIEGVNAMQQSNAIPPADTDRYNAAIAYVLLTAWSLHQSAGDGVIGVDLHPAVEICARLLRDEDPMNLDALAERSGLSASRLSELFKKQIGLSLVNYRQRQCLDRFLHDYDPQRHTMLDAALRAGFGSYPQFHRTFKQLMGIGPAEYRRREQ